MKSAGRHLVFSAFVVLPIMGVTFLLPLLHAERPRHGIWYDYFGSAYRYFPDHAAPFLLFACVLCVLVAKAGFACLKYAKTGRLAKRVKHCVAVFYVSIVACFVSGLCIGFLVLDGRLRGRLGSRPSFDPAVALICAGICLLFAFPFVVSTTCLGTRRPPKKIYFPSMVVGSLLLLILGFLAAVVFTAIIAQAQSLDELRKGWKGFWGAGGDKLPMAIAMLPFGLMTLIVALRAYRVLRPVSTYETIQQHFDSGENSPHTETQFHRQKIERMSTAKIAMALLNSTRTARLFELRISSRADALLGTAPESEKPQATSPRRERHGPLQDKLAESEKEAGEFLKELQSPGPKEFLESLSESAPDEEEEQEHSK